MKSYHDIVGDGGSRVLEQVEAQRERIARQLSGVRHRLAVASGKGGVGKSTLTFHLAQALRARGLAVAILDADWNGPSQARLAGIAPGMALPGASGLLLPRSREGIPVFSTGSLLAEGEALEFDSVASGDSQTWRATREFALLGEVLAGVEWGRLDALLLDLPPGVERTLQHAEFLGPAMSLLLVTLPTDLSRAVVARSARALRGTPNRVLGYVENMSGYWCAACAEERPLFPAAGEVRLDLPCLGRVPFDPALFPQQDGGRPLPSRSSSGGLRALDALAGRVLETLEAAP